MKSTRRGVTILETTIALMVLAASFLAAAQMLAALAAQQRLAERRSVAIREAGNLMEQTAALAWADLTDERAKELQLSPLGRQALPQAELAVEISAGETADEKRIVVEIRYQQPGAAAPVRLTAWRRRVEAAS